MNSLYTIGYEGLSLEQFIEKLKKNHISVLIDVRELPLSRKPGFSKTKLSKELEAAGVQYSSMRRLGSPRDLRHELRETQDWSDFSSKFRLYLREQTDLLENLAERAHNQATCLMCFEKNSSECHRSIVAERVVALDGNGLQVRNL